MRVHTWFLALACICILLSRNPPGPPFGPYDPPPTFAIQWTFGGTLEC
jgi:hypothetical protein